MAYENIIYEAKGGIATITFNRPKALNALNGALLGELSQALDDISADEDIRALVLTGAGDKSFVAGADITEQSARGNQPDFDFTRKFIDIGAIEVHGIQSQVENRNDQRAQQQRTRQIFLRFDNFTRNIGCRVPAGVGEVDG